MKLLTSFFLVILCAASFASAQSSGAGSPPVQPAAPSAAGTATGPMGAGATPGPSGAAAAQTAGSVTYTLQQVLAQGMKNGPAVQTARLTLQSAGDTLSQAAAKNAPALSTSAAYAHDDLLGTSTPTASAIAAPSGSTTSVAAPGESFQGALNLTTPSTKVSVQATQSVPDSSAIVTTSAVGVSLSQTLFDGYPGGRAYAAFQQARYAYQIAQLAYQSALQTQVYSVEQAYYLLLGDQNTVVVRRQNLNQAKDNLAQTEAYLKAGNASSLDVLQSQIAERSAELDLATAQNTVAQDRQKLSVLVGWPIDSGYTVATVTVPTTPTITLDNAVATALANRVELKQILLNRESDAVSLKSASIQNLPVVSVNGGASYRLYWSGTGSSGTWNAGVSVSLPILDGGLAAAQVSQAQSALDQLSVQEAQQKQNITIGVRGAYFSVTDAGNRLALAQQNVDQAQKQYELEKIKFTAGLASNLDVLTAFVTLTNAQVAEEAANTTLSLAVLNLQQAMGTIDYSPSP